jgi:D-3-phosphoglycerate dehydrogenase
VNDKTFRVLVADAVSEAGIETLRATPGIEVTVRTGMDEPTLVGTVRDHDALIVRSATKVTAAVLREPGRLKVIGRAGTGVDNIDLDAATRAGIVVLNTPGGNSVAAAELTMALVQALARNIPQANQSLREGRWEPKKYTGTELAGKVLGVLGLGRIGREVALRAKAFRMDVLGHDPFVSRQVVEGLGIRAGSLDEVVAGSDFLTLHLPVSEDTRNLIDAGRIARMRAGARIVNCARGGLVDEGALLDALESGHLAGAALDVFASEPPSDRRLIEHPRVVSTPHLGASTREAQERVGTEIAEKVRDFLANGVILDAVNFPSIRREDYAVLGPIMDLAERLGSFLGQLADGGCRRFELRAYGTYAGQPSRPVAMAATRGLLRPMLQDGVSYVNALALAGERGITVEEARSNEPSPFAGLLRLSLETERGRATVAGTLYGPDRPRLVEVDGVPIEAYPQGDLLFFRNRDVPGVVGKIGTILGRSHVNIAGIQLGRASADHAVSIINVDGPVPRASLEEIRQIPEILTVRSLTV